MKAMFKTHFSRRQILTGLSGLVLAAPACANATSTGIIFAGASWCPVCKKAAPVLAAISERFGVPVLVASADERPIPPFPNLVPLAGHPLARSVAAYPTTLIYNAKSDTVIGSIEGYKSPTWYLGTVTAFIRQSEEAGR